MNLPKKLHLEVWHDLTVEGEGNEVVLKARAGRKRKYSADYERTDLAVTMPRYYVKVLIQQLAAMHQRDRKRIEREGNRIDGERQAMAGEAG